jgi:hypothetical protein
MRTPEQQAIVDMVIDELVRRLGSPSVWGSLPGTKGGVSNEAVCDLIAKWISKPVPEINTGEGL